MIDRESYNKKMTEKEQREDDESPNENDNQQYGEEEQDEITHSYQIEDTKSSIIGK